MLIPLGKLIEDHNLKIEGVLHLGAHLGEEAEAYYENRCEPIYWVEANPELIRPLGHHVRQFPEQFVMEELVLDEIGKEVTFHISANDTTPRGKIDRQSSSVLELGTHLQSSPDVYFAKDITCISTTVDDLVDRGLCFNFMNLDLQGAELLALHGATEALDRVDAIYTEVNKKQVYKGCAQVGQLDGFLDQWSFRRMETVWASPTAGWGDALYVKDGLGYA